VSVRCVVRFGAVRDRHQSHDLKKAAAERLLTRFVGSNIGSSAKFEVDVVELP
jgi:hypothetical protein